MSTAITHLAAEEHVEDLQREPQRPNQLREARHRDLLRETQLKRDRVKVRRVAVIRLAGSHFVLQPAPERSTRAGGGGGWP